MPVSFHPVSWKRNINKVPETIRSTLSQIPSDLVIVAVTKKIAVSDIAKGTYNHLGLSFKNGQLTVIPSVVPSENMGKFSKRNKEGWEIVRRDLPKITKTFYWESPNFGDEITYGTHEHSQDREVWQREHYEPRFLPITVEVLKSPESDDGFALIKFAVQDILDRTRDDFERNLLFNLNLLQENTGAIHVYPSEATRQDFIGMIALDWEVFPPGTVEEMVAALSKGKSITPGKAGIIEERVKLFSTLKPIAYLRGTGGLSAYIGAQFADDLVVFENMNYGNALYVLYENWEDIAKRSRIDLLKGTDKNFDRFIHTGDWKDWFLIHMKKALRKRGIIRQFRR